MAEEAYDQDLFVVGDALVSEGDEVVEPLEYDEDDPNLAPAFSEHPDGVGVLKRVAGMVIRKFDACESESAEYRERMAENFRLFTGDLPPKTWPFADCANAHVPIMIENTMRIVSRIMGELFDDWRNFFGVLPTGPDDEEQASILTLHGNWQFQEDIKDFPRQMERGVMFNIIAGDVSAHSYWDSVTQRNRHEILTPDELYVPFTYTSTMPDYSDCPYVIKLDHKYRHQIQAMRAEWNGVDKVLGRDASHDDDPPEYLSDVIADIHGKTPDDDDGAASYKLLHYEGWDDGLLPGQEDDRFIQAIVDPMTQTVLKLAIHEEADWKERERSRVQTAELEEYLQGMEVFAEANAAAEQIAAASGGELQGIDAAMAVEPTPPEWFDPEDPSVPPPTRKSPIHMFTHGVSIEPLTGMMGLGYGQIQADYNRGANTAMSQYIDASTLANAWTILTTDRVQFDDTFEMSPGKVNKASGIHGDDLRKNIMELKPGPADRGLMEVVDKLYGYGQTSMQAPAVLSGEPGKSGETYRGLASRIEQAVKQLSVSSRKHVMVFLRQILKNNAYLNSIFLPEFEMRRLMDWTKAAPTTLPITRAMYERDYNVTLRADLRFTSEGQRIQEAMELLGLAGQIPELQVNPLFRYTALKKLLTARKQHDMVHLLGEPPPRNPQFVAPPPQPQQGQPPNTGQGQQ